MPLYIRDDDVDVLAKRVQKAIKAPSKTEAVRIALQHELARAREVVPLRDRVKKLQAMARAMGPDDPNLDMKRFMDEMWDDA